MSETIETITRTLETSEPESISGSVPVENAIAAVVAVTEGTNEWQQRSYETLAALLTDIREERAENQRLLTELTVRVKDLTETQTLTNLKLDQVSAQPIAAVVTIPEPEPMIPTTEPETHSPETRVTDENVVVANPDQKIAKRVRRLI